MRVVEYDPSRRGEVADLMALVWGERPAEEELAWFYERNPVRPASVLLAEEGGRTVATAAISFVRMSIGDESLEVGMPLRVATDPAYRGRGIFAELESRNEERVRDLGIRLLLTVPNAASRPIFLNKLGWKPLPPLRVWARLRAGAGRPRGQRVERFAPAVPPTRAGVTSCCATPTGSTGALRIRRPRTSWSRARATPSPGAVGATASSRLSRASCCRTRAPRPAPTS